MTTHPPFLWEAIAETAFLADGKAGVLLKLSAPHIELNVWLTQKEAQALAEISADEASAHSVRLGVSAGSAVHWSQDREGNCYLLVGEDDETWDIGLTLDRPAFEQMLAALKTRSSL